MPGWIARGKVQVSTRFLKRVSAKLGNQISRKAKKAEQVDAEFLPVIAKIRAPGATSLHQIAAGPNAHRDFNATSRE